MTTSSTVKVDITILSWDRIDETLAAIESALAQRLIDHHVYVVDQGSKPENIEKLKSYADGKENLTVVFNSENRGVPGGRNQASFIGNGKYIVSLDNDAEFSDAYQLSKAVSLMEKNEDIGAIGFRIKCFGLDVDDASSWSYKQDINEWASTPFLTDHFVGAGHLFRRTCFEKVNGYDDKLFFMLEESDLSARLINAGYTIRYSPEVVIEHKVSSENRVNWSEQRWYYNVRNALYLQRKRGDGFLATLFNILMFIKKGFHSNMLTKTFSAIFAAIAMFPNAHREQRLNKYTKQTKEAKHYVDVCLGREGMSKFQKIKGRLLKTRKPIGQ